MADAYDSCEANIVRALTLARPIGGASQASEAIYEALRNAEWLLVQVRRLERTNGRDAERLAAEFPVSARDVFDELVAAVWGVKHSELVGMLTDVCQLLDGWHQDGTAWSEWDESVRQRVSDSLHDLYSKPRVTLFPKKPEAVPTPAGQQSIVSEKAVER